MLPQTESPAPGDPCQPAAAAVGAESASLLLASPLEGGTSDPRIGCVAPPGLPLGTVPWSHSFRCGLGWIALRVHTGSPGTALVDPDRRVPADDEVLGVATGDPRPQPLDAVADDGAAGIDLPREAEGVRGERGREPPFDALQRRA